MKFDQGLQGLDVSFGVLQILETTGRFDQNGNEAAADVAGTGDVLADVGHRAILSTIHQVDHRSLSVLTVARVTKDSVFQTSHLCLFL